MSLLKIDEPAAKGSDSWFLRYPIWRLGFRPFYLLAAVFGALAIPLWIAKFFGVLPDGLHVGLGWHMHEMVFGFVTAVVVGFLFTAARNWTGLPTPVQGHLAALAGLWLAGRVAMLCPPSLLTAAIDWLFLPLAAWPLLQVMRKANNRRNYFLILLLSLLAIANGLFHAAALGLSSMALAAPVQAAILVIVLIESAIGTRVIPMFTRNGAPGSNPVAKPMLDRVSIGLLAATSLAWIAGLGGLPFAGLGGLPFAVLAAAAGVLVLVRLAGWQPQCTVRVPLLWILHLSYGWIGIGFLMLAGTAMGWISSSAAFHALTVGSMAGLIIGMMTRTTLGHTGRPLKVGKAEQVMFALVQLGALARVGSALGLGGWHDAALVVSASCWCVAFLLYAWVYQPYLSSPRIDGKEG